ncbi:MAG TPA: membrane-bound lytic murein transglycosylase MltF [Methylophilus sp.]|nr:membrane-bound lytic murein transglycosylase MltF [Methylophilus sp.]HQQ33450.1 membrane-bound lytic murein transglycosylase MltF [Methylophilus sp.]
MKNLIIILTGLLFSLSACKQENAGQKTTPPPPVKQTENVLTFVTINSPNTYYINNDKAFAGLEYDLAILFGQYLGNDTQVKFEVETSVEQALVRIISKKADIAAADISVTADRKKFVQFSTPYEDVQQQLIYNRNAVKKPPKSMKDLVGLHIVVPAGSSFVERLKALSKDNPGIMWEERNAVHSEQLLEAVANEEIQYTIADSHLVSMLQNYHPDLAVAFAVGEPEKIAWAFPKDGNPELLEKANVFFEKIKKDGTLHNLVDRYHGNTKRLKPLDVKTFLLRSQTLLPKYKRLFKQAQEITNLDWRLIAAISYQESHWDTFNTSPTNVRGLMMLTEDTADRMGVTDRLDPAQSIPAGAKYIKQLIDTVPDRVPEPDRIYMALASYNIGYAHLEDARVLAQRLGLNPDSWADVKKTLVMLNDPNYYINAKYGYCSCGQPVIFVESIRSYYNILSRFESPHDSTQESFKIAMTDMAI